MVIILHTNQIIEFSNIQREIIRNINQVEALIYKSFPTWIKVPFINNDCNIKNEIKLIENISILKPKLNPNENIFCPVEIKYNQEIYNSKLVLCTFINKNISVQIPKIPTLEAKFPIKIKIFRLAKEIEIDNYSSAIEDSAWKKLK